MASGALLLVEEDGVGLGSAAFRMRAQDDAPMYATDPVRCKDDASFRAEEVLILCGRSGSRHGSGRFVSGGRTRFRSWEVFPSCSTLVSLTPRLGRVHRP